MLLSFSIAFSIHRHDIYSAGKMNGDVNYTINVANGNTYTLNSWHFSHVLCESSDRYAREYRALISVLSAHIPT